MHGLIYIQLQVGLVAERCGMGLLVRLGPRHLEIRNDQTPHVASKTNVSITSYRTCE